MGREGGGGLVSGEGGRGWLDEWGGREGVVG